MTKPARFTIHQKRSGGAVGPALPGALVFLGCLYRTKSRIKFDIDHAGDVDCAGVVRDRIYQPDQSPDREQPELDPVKSIVPVVSLFAGYVITLPWLGFDVGTFLFISLFLWFHGERRWQWVLGYGLCAATLMALFFSAMLPYPMPMLLLATDY